MNPMLIRPTDRPLSRVLLVSLFLPRLVYFSARLQTFLVANHGLVPERPLVELELNFFLVHVITIQQLSLTVMPIASSSRRRIISEEPDDAASGEYTSVSQTAPLLICRLQRWTCRSR